MRFLALAAAGAAALAASPPASAQKIGQRNGTPEQLFSGIGDGSSESGLEAEIAAAASQPLGSIRNPVRVGGPEGERFYIARLRCADGSRPKVGLRAEGGTGAFGSIVHVYPLDCGAAAPNRTELVMDMYHEEHREAGAPAGFTIDPLPARPAG